MNVNQFYSENMAEDIKRGLYDNASNCMVANGHLPYGYKRDDTMHYVIDEAKAAVIPGNLRSRFLRRATCRYL